MAFTTNIWTATPDNLGRILNGWTSYRTKIYKPLKFRPHEMWSFVDFKKNKMWIRVVYFLALKQTLAVHFADQTKADLKAILDQLPSRLRRNCKFATDHFGSYYQLIPKDQHRLDKAFTYYIEGYFAGERARVSQLFRKALSFSKDLTNHIVAIRYFLWQRNLDRHPYI